MERVVEKTGAWGLVAAVGVVVMLYSLWGASVLHANQSNLTQVAQNTSHF